MLRWIVEDLAGFGGVEWNWGGIGLNGREDGLRVTLRTGFGVDGLPGWIYTK